MVRAAGASGVARAGGGRSTVLRAPGALAFLVGATIRGRLRRQLQRLRRPRHLVPVAAGACYFGWVLFGQRGEGRAAIGAALAAPGVDALLALLIAARAATWWVFGGDRSSLAFSPAEVHFLFPAPVARRDLLQYRLLSVQLRVLFSVLLLALLARRGPTLAAGVLRALAFWTLFTTLHLHRLGASLTRVGAAQHGRVGLRRNAVPIAVAGTGIAATGWAVFGAVRQPSFASDPLPALRAALEAPAAAAALYPFRIIVRPLVAADARAWVLAIGPALLVLAAHYFWVVRSGVAFEDAAVEASARAAERAAARRGGAGPAGAAALRRRAGAWLPLAPHGVPLAAVVWKNVVAAFRTLPLTGFLAALVATLPAALAFGLVPGYERAARVTATLALLWAAGVVLVGPQAVRNDLRQDLPRLALLRSYPLRGRDVVLAQLAAAAAVLTALGAPALVAAYLALLGDPESAGGPLARGALLVGALAAFPVLAGLALSVQNAAALLFPNWVRLGPSQRPAGLEASGQNLVVALLSLALLGLLLIGPVTGVAAAAWLLRPLVGAWGLAPGIALGLAAAAAELWWVARWLGGLFERTEPNEIG